jgi:hypothetical protein
MRGLKIEIGRTTVANILAEAGIEPAPERTRKRTWKHFLRCHWDTLYACDCAPRRRGKEAIWPTEAAWLHER